MSQSLAEQLSELRALVGGALAEELLEDGDDEEWERLAWDWQFWSRPEQRAPPDPWTYWVVLAGRGFGKALALDTPIATPSGWSTMGALRDGDLVFDESGRPTIVLKAHAVLHDRRCYRVRFDDGAEIVADAEHLWMTWDAAARKAHARAACPRAVPMVKTTEQIAATIHRPGRKRAEVNHSIPCAGALRSSAAALAIDPYVLGVWLGDGDSASATVTQGAQDLGEMVALIEACGVACGPRKRCASSAAFRFAIGAKAPLRDETTGRMIENGSIHSALRSMRLLGAKKIPSEYLRASVEQRRALLAGLMDTDGTVAPGGHVELTLTDGGLAADAFALVLSLGFKPTMSESDAKLNGRIVGRKWRITWTPHVPVFRLSRKLARQHGGRSQQARTTHRYIVAVDEIPSVPVRCITVDSPSRLYLAGRHLIATHNTRCGAEAVREIVATGEVEHVGLVAKTPADARDVMIEGPAGILAITPPSERPRWEPSKRRLTWPNGAHATVFSGENPDQLRGPQHQLAWVDELAAFQYPEETWDNLALGLRLPWRSGGPARAVVTTTPRPIKALRDLLALGGCVTTRGSTYENRGNLDDNFLRQMLGRYEGTRLGRQELMAELLEDVVGALWDRATIDRARRAARPSGDDLQRVVVAIDPAVTSGEESCETGIVVAARAADGHAYVLADRSCRLPPAGWARRAVDAADEFDADCIVAEANNGGEMVGLTIRTVAPRARVKLVHASRGKRLRAEPVSALYEQGRVHHVGAFPQLEDQMCSYTGATAGEASPDRLDALVWALSELSVSTRPRFTLA